MIRLEGVISLSRQARAKSESGIYHIMLRGINGQQIFEDEEDNQKFLEVLQDFKSISYYKIYAYCLMGNHLHLLLKVGIEDLETIFKRIGGRYVYWYNNKYLRRGHLFQDRYKSEPVEDDAYFLVVLRYIHQNPVHAGLSKTCGDYRHSSYHEYLKFHKNQLTDVEFGLGMISFEQFIKLNNQQNDDKCLDIDINSFRLKDEEAKKIIYRVSNCKNTVEFQRLELKQRDQFIKELKEECMSYRQISRLTGLNFGIVRKI
jgi:putative transposase